MNKYIYKIEHKIQTLAKNAVPDKIKKSYSSFVVKDIKFEQWNFNIRDGWLGNAWLAKSEVSSKDFIQTINVFRRRLRKIVPRIALISQSYIEFILEPFIIHKENNDKAFLHYTSNRKVGGLMFMGDEKKALEELLTSRNIPDEFYYYWNDAVNTFGYSGKLLLMIFALEALVRKRDKGRFNKPFDLYEYILGKRLAKAIFTKTTGLRSRLAHGDYFIPRRDQKKNYFDEIHKKVISFFNNEILSKPLLSEKVINPHRHFYGNKSEWHHFVKKVDTSATFRLKDVMREINKDDRVGFRNKDKYELVSINDYNRLRETY